jgi:nicotinamide riboside kinase
MRRPLVVALVGAESSGKTTLARQLGDALVRPDRKVAVVGEYLREFCDRTGRTPRHDEQRAIAAEQTRRIAAAAETHELVIADTSALMIAVYSELVFGDRSLYDEALEVHAGYDLTLLTALDLPWQADGHQRDGAHVREPVDALLRAVLARAGIAHAVIAGHGMERCAAALASIERALAPADTASPRWQWVCERCGDAGCERHRWLPGRPGR